MYDPELWRRRGRGPGRGQQTSVYRLLVRWLASPLFWDFENTQTMVALKLLVLSACLALAGAFAPMAAPLSGRAVAAATPAGSGIVMIRHANKLKKLNRPADQRKALLRGLTTELIRHGRIKTTTIRCKELRKTTDHMVTLAKDGSLHARRQVTHSSY